MGLRDHRRSGRPRSVSAGKITRADTGELNLSGGLTRNQVKGEVRGRHGLIDLSTDLGKLCSVKRQVVFPLLS
jgi:hypothetical protein